MLSSLKADVLCDASPMRTSQAIISTEASAVGLRIARVRLVSHGPGQNAGQLQGTEQTERPRFNTLKGHAAGGRRTGDLSWLVLAVARCDRREGRPSRAVPSPSERSSKQAQEPEHRWKLSGGRYLQQSRFKEGILDVSETAKALEREIWVSRCR